METDEENDIEFENIDTSNLQLNENLGNLKLNTAEAAQSELKRIESQNNPGKKGSGKSEKGVLKKGVQQETGRPVLKLVVKPELYSKIDRLGSRSLSIRVSGKGEGTAKAEETKESEPSIKRRSDNSPFYRVCRAESTGSTSGSTDAAMASSASLPFSEPLVSTPAFPSASIGALSLPTLPRDQTSPLPMSSSLMPASTAPSHTKQVQVATPCRIPFNRAATPRTYSRASRITARIISAPTRSEPADAPGSSRPTDPVEASPLRPLNLVLPKLGTPRYARSRTGEPPTIPQQFPSLPPHRRIHETRPTRGRRGRRGIAARFPNFVHMERLYQENNGDPVLIRRALLRNSSYPLTSVSEETNRFIDYNLSLLENSLGHFKEVREGLKGKRSKRAAKMKKEENVCTCNQPGPSTSKCICSKSKPDPKPDN